MSELEQDVKKLIRKVDRLYNDDDGFEGDIPEIKTHLKCLNGKVLKHDKSINRIYIFLALVLGGSVGIDRLFF